MAKPKNLPEVQSGVRREEENAQEANTEKVTVTPLLDVADVHAEYVRMVRSTAIYPPPHVADPVNKDMVEDYRSGGWMFEDELPEDERPKE